VRGRLAVAGVPDRKPTADVVSIGSRGGYRPDYKGLASAYIRKARQKLDLDHEAFSAHMSNLVGWRITPAVEERWEQGANVPLGDVVLAAQDISGDALAVSPADSVGPASSDEVVTPYADRGLITRRQWNGLIDGSASYMWLYGMAEFGYAIDDEVPAIVQEAAGRGCQVRVLLLSPDYGGLADLDSSEGSPPGTLQARIRAALARFAEMREACSGAMELRTYDAHPTVSIVRGDDDMLVTPYLRFFMGSNSPTLGISARSAPKMFGRYVRHFDGMWKLAADWTS
jgi:hypothetical protein